MTHQPDRPAATAISRREAIQRAALLAGVAFSSPWLQAAGRVQPGARPPAYLTPAQASMVAAVTERILPRTDTPGAVDVGVPAFIDLLYGEFMSPAEQQLLTRGLAQIEAAAASAGGGTFAALPAARQDELLRRLARAQDGQEDSPFRLIRAVTVLGYFTSEEVGRNVLHYDPVPGSYQPCIPIEQVGRRNWTV